MCQSISQYRLTAAVVNVFSGVVNFYNGLCACMCYVVYIVMYACVCICMHVCVCVHMDIIYTEHMCVCVHMDACYE